MKHECEIIRDLMPLCIDETASGKSCEAVCAHVAECKPCEQVYAEMKSAVTIPAPQPRENPEFARAVRRMKTRRKRRIWLTLLLGVLLAAMVAGAGLYGYYWYFVEHIRLEDAQLSLVTSTDGIALIHASNVPKSAYMTIRMSEMVYPESAVGQCEANIYLNATRYEAKNAADDIYFVIGNMEDGRVLVSDEWDGEVPVYRMLLARLDGSGQVFYLSGEEEPKVVSIRGAYLKSVTRTYYHKDETYQSVPFVTSTPNATLMPRSWVTDLTESGNEVIRMVSPTPMPTVTPGAEENQLEQVTPTPAP